MEEQEQLRQQIQQLEQMIRPLLTKKATERLGNIKVAHPENYVHALTIIAQLGKQIDDDQLKEILKKISSKNRFNIRYK